MVNRRESSNFNKTANIMLVIGLLLLAIPSGLWLYAHYYQLSEAKKWESTIKAGSTQTGKKHDNATKTAKNDPKKTDLTSLADRGVYSPGQDIAFLIIPKLNLRLSVIEGETWANLAKGPIHVSKTAKLGNNGTVLISGHRTMYSAPFHNLHELAPADKITIYTKRAVFTYEVAQIKQVMPDDWRDVTAKGEPRLILSTCDPIYSAARRLLIISRLIQASPLK